MNESTNAVDRARDALVRVCETWGVFLTEAQESECVTRVLGGMSASEAMGAYTLTELGEV